MTAVFIIGKNMRMVLHSHRKDKTSQNIKYSKCNTSFLGGRYKLCYTPEGLFFLVLGFYSVMPLKESWPPAWMTESCWFLSHTWSCYDSGLPVDFLWKTETCLHIFFHIKLIEGNLWSMTYLFLCVYFPVWRSLVSQRQIWNRSLEWC